jgi:hypothetical protein
VLAPSRCGFIGCIKNSASAAQARIPGGRTFITRIANKIVEAGGAAKRRVVDM